VVSTVCAFDGHGQWDPEPEKVCLAKVPGVYSMDRELFFYVETIVSVPLRPALGFSDRNNCFSGGTPKSRFIIYM
jgi:hypothetical protein